MGQILGAYRGQFAIVGGAVPWLLLGDKTDMAHVGTLDIDVGLDAQALGDGEYALLVESLLANGYQQRGELKRFQLVRPVPMHDGGMPIDVIVDFLRPRDVEITKNAPPLLDEFAVQRADGADLALQFNETVRLSGLMPTGGRNTVELVVCSIPALLAMKGHAIQNRWKQKDAYDIYYCVRNYPGGLDALADACRPLLEHLSGATGYRYIAEKFDGIDGFGPTCVRRFVEETAILGERTPDQWQQDAYGQVDAWLRALSLK